MMGGGGTPFGGHGSMDPIKESVGDPDLALP